MSNFLVAISRQNSRATEVETSRRVESSRGLNLRPGFCGFTHFTFIIRKNVLTF